MTDLRGDHQLSVLDAEVDLAFRMKTTCKAAHFPCRLLANVTLPSKCVVTCSSAINSGQDMVRLMVDIEAVYAFPVLRQVTIQEAQDYRYLGEVFGHIYEECPKNTGAGEKKTMKKPSQTFRGVSVSNSNLFDVLNSVDNDEEFGTNGGTTNLVNNEATSSGSSFMNADNDGEFASNTPIGEKIDKIEREIMK
ncbi:hypothetical protein Tco_0932419, partial [Tanacetum coccineum]